MEKKRTKYPLKYANQNKELLTLKTEKKPMKKFISKQVSASETYETTEYVFEFSPLNREIDEKKVNQFVRLFESGANFLKLFPIIVCPKTFFILDGQHRYTACKKLGIPVFYKWNEEKKLTIKNVSDIQTNGKWGTNDYLHVEVAKGNNDYKILKEFSNRYKMPISSAVKLLGVKDFKHSGFYDAAFRVKDLENATKVANCAEQFGIFGFNFHNQRNFILAISTAMNHEDYDHKHMMDSAEKNIALLKRQFNKDEYLRNLELLYNYRSKIKKIRFF